MSGTVVCPTMRGDTIKTKEADEMQTKNGLTIHRVERKRGGFDIELRAPAEHDTEGKPFAVISRGDGGVWLTRKRNTRSPDVLFVINSVDLEYAKQKERETAENNRRQEERERLNECFAKDWQKVINHYCCATPADE